MLPNMTERVSARAPASASAQNVCCAAVEILTFDLAGGGRLHYCVGCRLLVVDETAPEPEQPAEIQKPTEAQQRAFARRNSEVLERVLHIIDGASITRKELLYAVSGYIVSVARATNQDPIERAYAECNMLEVLRARLGEQGE